MSYLDSVVLIVYKKAQQKSDIEHIFMQFAEKATVDAHPVQGFQPHVHLGQLRFVRRHIHQCRRCSILSIQQPVTRYQKQDF